MTQYYAVQQENHSALVKMKLLELVPTEVYKLFQYVAYNKNNIKS